MGCSQSSDKGGETGLVCAHRFPPKRHDRMPRQPSPGSLHLQQRGAYHLRLDQVPSIRSRARVGVGVEAVEVETVGAEVAEEAQAEAVKKEAMAATVAPEVTMAEMAP